MRRFSPALNVDHVPSCHSLFCEHYVASLYLYAPVGKPPDRVFPPMNCFFRVTPREAKCRRTTQPLFAMGKICIESTARTLRIIHCRYIRYVCYQSNQLAVRILIQARRICDSLACASVARSPLINIGAIEANRELPALFENTRCTPNSSVERQRIARQRSRSAPVAIDGA